LNQDEWQLVLRLIEGMAQRDLFPDKVPNSEKALCLFDVPKPFRLPDLPER
jgi:hypothetical protein